MKFLELAEASGDEILGGLAQANQDLTMNLTDFYKAVWAEGARHVIDPCTERALIKRGLVGFSRTGTANFYVSPMIPQGFYCQGLVPPGYKETPTPQERWEILNKLRSFVVAANPMGCFHGKIFSKEASNGIA